MRRNRWTPWSLPLLLLASCGDVPASAPPPPVVRPVALPVVPAVVPPVAPPVVAPPVVAPVAAADPAAVTPPAAEARFGTGDPIPLALPMPAVEGDAYEPITAEWSVFRTLLTATTPISRGTRSGYTGTWGGTEIDLSEAPRPFRSERPRPIRGPGWWRPAPGVLLLVVPFELSGARGGIGIGFYEVGADGARYVTHLPEFITFDSDSYGCGSIFTLAVGQDRRLRILDGCSNTVDLTTLGVAGTQVEIEVRHFEDGRPSGEARDPRVPIVSAPTFQRSGLEMLRAFYCCHHTSSDQCTGEWADHAHACQARGSGSCQDCLTRWMEDTDGPWDGLVSECGEEC